MTKKRKWTTEEEQVLIDQISKSANNIREAFVKTSKLIDRTETACKEHWYMVISKRKNSSVCFATIGYKTRNINRKIVHANTSDNTEVTTISWWKKVIKLLLHK